MRSLAAILRVIGDWQARALLTLCYYVVLAPFAFVAGRSKPFEPTGWQNRDEEPPDPARQS